MRKVEEFWKTDYLDRTPPVEGAYEGLVALKNMGFRLVLVTARQQRELERSLQWLEKHFPGLIDWMICTGQSQETLADEKELLTKLSKADVRFLSRCHSPLFPSHSQCAKYMYRNMCTRLTHALEYRSAERSAQSSSSTIPPRMH